MKRTTMQGHAPYGFQWKNRKLEVVSEEAAVRKLAFELFLEVGSRGGVARKLNERGHRTRRGGLWSDVQVNRILTCRSAIGLYLPRRKSESAKADPSEVPDEIICPAIVPVPLWERAAAVMAGPLERRPSSPATQRNRRPFTGKVFCRCGESMRLGGDCLKFCCGACRNRIVLSDLEDILAEDIAEVVVADPLLGPLLLADDSDRQLILELVRASLEANIAREERRQLETLLVGGTLSPARFGALEREVSDRLRSAEEKIARLRKNQPTSPARQMNPSDASAYFIKRWKDGDAVLRNRIVNTLIDRITVGPDSVDITYSISDPTAEDASRVQQTKIPTNQTVVAISPGTPTYIRLPKSKEKCPYTGLSRAKLNELILPNARNNFSPPVKSRSVKNPGARQGVRLILLESLMEWITSGD